MAVRALYAMRREGGERDIARAREMTCRSARAHEMLRREPQRAVDAELFVDSWKYDALCVEMKSASVTREEVADRRWFSPV